MIAAAAIIDVIPATVEVRTRTRFSTVCHECHPATRPVSLRVAGIMESEWERHPIDVQNFRCTGCGVRRRWWYFRDWTDA